MPRADWEIVGHQPLPLPPLEAQRRIARFLDEKTARIDGLIEKKRALLERLAERRQALITRAVHKGINPDASMKPSGIGWLGDIPAHWKVQRLRFSVKKFEQGWSPQCDNRPAQPGEWGVLKVGCVNGEFYDEGENKVLPSELDPVERYEVMVGDILVSRANTKELLGSAALVESTQGNMIFSDKLYRITLRDHLDPRYLIGVLRSPLSRLQYEQDATGTSGSMQNIGQDTIKNLVHPLPPYPEQIQIGERLTTMRTEETALRDQVSLSLSRMHEYRSALITSAVTGRIGELQ
jgi:type I restriction enzyme S subunit